MDMRRSTLVFAFLFLLLLAKAQNVTVSGAVIGNGSYPNLNSAFAAINAGAQTGASITVTVVNDTWEGGSTAILNAGIWSSLTVVPSGGPRRVVGATQPGQALIALNGADHVTFNGQLPGGVRGLTLENTRVSDTWGTCTVILLGDATLNTFTYCKLLGSSQTLDTTPGATVCFATGQVSVGNDNNTISYCDIGPSGSNLPTKAVFSQGDPFIYNSENLITHCNIYDYFHPNVSSNGIVLYHGNLNWTIRLNRFYQTTPRLSTGAAYHRDILLNSSLGNYYHLIDANTFGYANSAGTGVSSFRSSIPGTYYVPIDVPVVDDLSYSSITNNVISGISFPALSGSDKPINFIGIAIEDGIWGVSGNTIGSSTVAGSISMTNLSGAVIVRGIDLYTGLGGVSAINNLIGGFQLDAPTGAAISFTGIKGYNVQTVNANTVTGNQIGFAGAPIVVNGAGTNDRVIGIDLLGPDLTVSNNTVAYLSSKTANAGISIAAGVIGILTQGNGSADNTDINKVIALESTHPSAAVTVIGIIGVGGEFTRRNLVHSLSAFSPNAKLEGIHVGLGTPGVHANNMVRLGRDRFGQGLSNGISIIGLYEDAGFHDFVFNSVYIGGDNVGGSAQTYAFYGIGSSTTRRWRSNIYYNARSNGNGTGRHYACFNTTTVPGASPNSAGNDFYVSGNGGVLGHIFGQDVLTMPAWQALTGDIGSISSDPNFIQPNGDALTGDLHIGPISPIEAAGMPFATVTVDYDNQARSGLTPVDIGADAVITQAQAPQLPEIVLTGNGQLIADGDTVVGVADGTDFGAGYCDVQQPQAFVLQNTGTAPLLISSFGISGPGAAQFSVVVPPPGVVAPGQSATFTLAFTASVVGTASAQFNLSCNDWDETYYNFAVQGSSLGDTAPPVAVCNPLNLYVGSGGSVAVSAPAVAAGSTDNCSIASYTSTPTAFTCSQLGAQSVVVQVADYFGQMDACSTTVMVLDTTRPTALCRNLSANLDAGGQAVLSPAAFDNGSTDNCGIDSLWASAVQFDCSGLGLNLVAFSVRDASGNVGTCTAQLSILDTQAPQVNCQPAAVVLDASGQASLNPVAVEASSSDNCGVVGRSLDIQPFTCAHVGSTTVTLSVVDASGNVGTCQTQVSVSDTLRPAITCTSANLYLDASGQATLPPSAVATATDNCAIATYTLSASQFNCGDVGQQALLVTARDLTGNADSCAATIQVLDTLAPVLSCQNTVLSVGTSGSTPLNTALVLAGSSDNCGIDTLFLSRSSVSCADAGVVPVLVSAVDIHGNLATCTAQVAVQAVPLGLSLLAPATTSCGYQIPCVGMTLDSVHALASGGCAPYTYAWSNGQAGASATGLGAGVHSVTVTDGLGTTVVQSIQLTAPTLLSANIVTQQTPCGLDSTGMLSLSASGGNACQPYSYLWSNGTTGSTATGLPAGTHSVTVTDVAGCTVTASVVLVARPVPQPMIAQSQDTLFCSPAFSAYQWSLNGLPIVGATNAYFVASAQGLYTVTVPDTNGCLGTSVGYPYTGVALQPGLLGWSGIRLYPNPGRGVFQFALTQAIEGPLWLSVTDLSGRVVYQEALAMLEGGRVFDLSAVAAGVYVVALRGAEGQTLHFRLSRE